jgi:cell division protein FtsI/penicillin-binding protein 2
MMGAGKLMTRCTHSFFVAILLAGSAAVAQPQPALTSTIRLAMHGRQGTAVVLDVESGRVLASYDLERAGRRLVRPGSAIKPFVLATLADNGLLRGEAGIRCSRYLSIAGRKLNCGHPPMAARLRAEEALAYSCNSYFTQMGARLTGVQLREGLSRWGLASRTGLLRDEIAGEIELGRTKEEIELQSLGEENVSITPLGLLHGYLRLARERRSGAMGAHEAIFRGLEASTGYGMARMAQPEEKRGSQHTLRIAGKTGTSIASEGPWTHAWFAGYAPSDAPEIVLLVFLENGAGPTDAAPIARELFSAWAAEQGR